MARPQTYTDETRVCVAPDGSSKLQAGGDRRALVDYLIGEGGAATLGAIDRDFGVSMRSVAVALIRANWLKANVNPPCPHCGGSGELT